MVEINYQTILIIGILILPLAIKAGDLRISNFNCHLLIFRHALIPQSNRSQDILIPVTTYVSLITHPLSESASPEPSCTLIISLLDPLLLLFWKTVWIFEPQLRNIYKTQINSHSKDTALSSTHECRFSFCLSASCYQFCMLQHLFSLPLCDPKEI